MNYLNRRHTTNLLSRWFGHFAATAFPGPFQKLINYGYVKLMGLDMREFDTPSSYPTLAALFTRALKTPRSVEGGKKSIVSPCDARITACGKIEGETLFQIKGMPYSFKQLVKGINDKTVQALENGVYANFYLSPKDYHRYHAPCDLKVLRRIHIPGKLYPVNFPYLRKKQELFLQNERVVLECVDSAGKPLVLVYVGALNVGQMVFTFSPDAPTNTVAGKPMEFGYDQLQIAKGELMGWFNMGSTIVLLAPKEVQLEVAAGDLVRFGEKIGKLPA